MKIVGQSFWHFISEDTNLYKDIVEPIGYRARQHHDDFRKVRGALLNRLSLEFAKDFCDSNGYIQWPKLIEFNSGNMKE